MSFQSVTSSSSSTLPDGCTVHHGVQPADAATDIPRDEEDDQDRRTSPLRLTAPWTKVAPKQATHLLRPRGVHQSIGAEGKVFGHAHAIEYPSVLVHAHMTFLPEKFCDS